MSAQKRRTHCFRVRPAGEAAALPLLPEFLALDFNAGQLNSAEVISKFDYAPETNKSGMGLPHCATNARLWSAAAPCRFELGSFPGAVLEP
jgi:hypothetical protein